MRQGSDERRWWKRYGGTGLLAVMAAWSVSGAFAAGLNDTGQTTCYASVGAAVSPEPSTHPRQDCTVGRDAAAAAGVLPKIGGGSKGFDYTKIANNGSELPADATLGPGANQWACTRDNVTSLTWEVKTNDSGLRNMYWTYTWYDDIHTDNNGGDPGSKGSDTCNGTLPNSECNTQAYVAAVNAARLCGQHDWRMPTARELGGLVNYGTYSGPKAIDGAYFPNTAQLYWSSSTYARKPASAWGVNFDVGGVYGDFTIRYGKNVTNYVRLVRGL